MRMEDNDAMAFDPYDRKCWLQDEINLAHFPYEEDTRLIIQTDKRITVINKYLDILCPIVLQKLLFKLLLNNAPVYQEILKSAMKAALESHSTASWEFTKT